MQTAEAGRTQDWEGGSLDELLGLLAEPALSAYIEAVRPGSGQAVGEIHVVAGGVADAIAGERQGDEATNYIRKIPGLRFRVTPALPNGDGMLLPPPPAEGSLGERPVTTIMRYCEDFVLTCALELSRGTDNARISYRRGEIIRTLVDGSEAPERLPDVISWTDGNWRIVLPQLNLPRPKKPQRPAPGEVGGGTLFGIPAPVIPGLAPGPAPAPVAAAPISALPPGMTPAPAPASLSAPPAAARMAAPTPAPAAASSPPPPAAPLMTPAPAVSPPAPALSPPAPAASPPAPAPPTLSNAPATVIDLAPPRMTPPRPATAATSAVARPVADDTRATPAPAVPAPPRPSIIRPPPRGFASLPLVVHVVLGVALGAAVVVGYWAFIRFGEQLGLR